MIRRNDRSGYRTPDVWSGRGQSFDRATPRKNPPPVTTAMTKRETIAVPVKTFDGLVSPEFDGARTARPRPAGQCNPSRPLGTFGVHGPGQEDH